MVFSVVKISRGLPWTQLVRNRIPRKQFMSARSVSHPAQQTPHLRSFSNRAPVNLRNTDEIQMPHNFSELADKHHLEGDYKTIMMHHEKTTDNGVEKEKVTICGNTVDGIASYVDSLVTNLLQNYHTSSTLDTIIAARAAILQRRVSTRYVRYHGNNSIEVVNLVVSSYPISGGSIPSGYMPTDIYPEHICLELGNELNMLLKLYKFPKVEMNTTLDNTNVINAPSRWMIRPLAWLLYHGVVSSDVWLETLNQLPQTKKLTRAIRLDANNIILVYPTRNQRIFIRNCYNFLLPWRNDRDIHHHYSDNTVKIKGNKDLITKLDMMIAEGLADWTEIRCNWSGDVNVLHSARSLNSLFPKASFYFDPTTRQGSCFGHPPEAVAKLAACITDPEIWSNRGELQSKDKFKLHYIREDFEEKRKRNKTEVSWSTPVHFNEAKAAFLWRFFGNIDIEKYAESYKAVLDKIVISRLPIPETLASIPVLRSLINFYLQTYHSDMKNVLVSRDEDNVVITSVNEEDVFTARDIIEHDIFLYQKAQFIRESNNSQMKKLEDFLELNQEAHHAVKVKFWKNRGIGIIGSPEAIAKLKKVNYSKLVLKDTNYDADFDTKIMR